MELKIALAGNVFGRFDEPSAGKKLYAVVNIDKDDAEDSVTQLWIANDEGDLEELVKAGYCGEAGDQMREHFSIAFDWGFFILHTELATIK